MCERMKMVRNSLETVRQLLGCEKAQSEEVSGKVQQLTHLEQLLMDQEARLDAVNKVLEEFNYSVAHELFAPLRRISGFTREIQQRCLDELDLEGVNSLNSILESSQHMNELIEALMQVSRLLHAELQISTVDLSEAARGVAEELRQGAPQREVEFVIQPDLQVKGDAALLKVAIGKLLENAWKFTSLKDHARIEFGKVEGEGGGVFYVRDNGAGFGMEGYERLFHPFQRLHERELFPGNGLGLTAVKRIIERHGGKVWAESSPEAGATFYFSLN